MPALPHRAGARAARYSLAALAGATAALAGPPAAGAANPSVRLFPLTAPANDIVAGTDGGLWIADQTGSLVRADLTSSGFQRGVFAPGTVPTTLAAGPDGGLWYTDNSNTAIGRFELRDGATVQVFSLGTTVPSFVTSAADGNVWFGSVAQNLYGRVTPGGDVTTRTFPTPNSSPTAATSGPDGALYIAEYGANRIALVSQRDASLVREFSTGSAKPTSIATGADGNIWFAAEGLIGRLDPTTGAVTEFAAGTKVGPLGNAGLVAGPDGNIWFLDSGGRQVGRITPAGEITMVPVAVPAGTLPCSMTVGPDANLWFTTCLGSGFLGRVTTGEAPMRFTDPAEIRVPAQGTSGPASEYPAAIDVSGLKGTVTGVTVRLNGLHHARASDLLAQLVGPQGQRTVLMANATSRPGDSGTPPDAYDGDVITFSEAGREPGRYLTSGVFRPFNPGFALNFTAPAPANVPAPPADLSVFNGADPNGAWKLFLYDDEAGTNTIGELAGGWSLDVQTTGPTVTVPGPTTTVTVQGPTITVPGGSAQADRAAPVLTLGKLPASVTLAALRKGLKVGVSANEAVSLEASLRAAVSTAKIAAGGRRAPASFPLELDAVTGSTGGTGAATLVLKPSSKLLGRPRQAFTLQLRVRGTDSGGNAASVTRTIRVTLTASKARR